MLNNNKGITMMALIITIMILIILVTITIRTSSPVIKEAKLEEARTTLLLIQAKWKVEIEKAKFNGDSMFPDDQIVQQVNIDDGTYVAEEKWQLIPTYKITLQEAWKAEEGINYYRLTRERLNDMGLGDVEESNSYVVNYSNDDIILEDGIEYDDVIYYKLSDIEELFD